MKLEAKLNVNANVELQLFVPTNHRQSNLDKCEIPPCCLFELFRGGLSRSAERESPSMGHNRLWIGIPGRYTEDLRHKTTLGTRCQMVI